MEHQIVDCIGCDDFDGAIRRHVILELQYEGNSLFGTEQQFPGKYFYTSYLACYLLKGDLSSAKYLWKRAPPQWKASVSGSMLAEMWEVGKSMWMGDSASAMIKLSISWPSDVTFLVVKLKELLETQVLCTVEGTFEEISLANLAMRLNAPPSDLIPRLKLLGWTVDESQGTVRPVPSNQNIALVRIQKGVHENHQLLQNISGIAAHLEKEGAKVEK